MSRKSSGVRPLRKAGLAQHLEGLAMQSAKNDDPFVVLHALDDARKWFVTTGFDQAHFCAANAPPRYLNECFRI